MHVPFAQLALTAVRRSWPLLGGAEWPEKPFPVGFRRRSALSSETGLAKAEPHGIGVALALRLRKIVVSSPKESKKDECRMSAPKQGQLWPTGSFPRRRVLHPVLPTCLARRVFCNPHADGFGRWMLHV